ncbi:MAG: VCBS repeat-containing protein, partial [Roseibacillus sp.]|nr:VCBS repeat-containing protein [Roseibacillus sp.]
MSQAPETTAKTEKQGKYLTAFSELAQRIRDGASFSGRERHCAFLNTGQGRFADISAVSGFGLPSDGRGLAITDWDHDGDLDLWLSNRSAPRAQFLQNRIPPQGSGWIAFRLQGDPSRNCPQDGIGSQVELVTGNSPQRRIKTLHAGNGLM